MLQQILLVVQVLAAVALIALVLLQQGRGADAGAAFGAGGAGTLFGARGPTTVLTRATAIFAIVFFINSLGLSYLASQRVETRSVVDRVEELETGSHGGMTPADIPSDPVPAGDMPVAPDAPSSGSDVPSLPGSTE